MLKRFFLAVCVAALVAGGALAATLVASDGASTRASSTTSIDAIQLAAANTEAAESMQFELRTPGDLRATGVVSGDGQQGQLSIDFGSFGNVEQRIVDGVVYMKAAERFSRSSRQWLAFSLGDPGTVGDGSSSALNGSPTSALDLLDEVAGPVETIGDDTVAGRHATHYRVTADAEGTPTPVDVWIDDHDRVVKVQGAVPDGGEITFEVTAFGVPVDVQAPPADQVVEFPGLSDLLGTGVI